MCSVRFTLTKLSRKAVEGRLKTAHQQGNLRQVKYLLAILAVGDGRSFAEVAVVLRVLAFSPFDTIAHDEILQYQERAYRMVFGYGLVPWESRYGIRNALIPDLIAAAMAGTRLFTGDPGAAVMAGRIVVGIVCLAAVPAAYALGSARSRT